MVAALREEIARLKGGPGRPDIKANTKPSGMEKVSEAQPADPSGERRRRGSTRVKLTIHEASSKPKRRPARVSKAMRATWCRI